MEIYKAKSIKELLSKEVLSTVIDNIEDMDINLINTSGLSGSKMYKLLVTYDGQKKKNLYLKINNLKEDWLAKASNDKGRELTIFKEDVFEKIEPFIKGVYIGYYEHSDYYAILMNDMSEYVGANTNSEDYYAYLDNLARFHAKFSEHDIFKYKSLLSVEDYYYFLTEDILPEELKVHNDIGWKKIKEILGKDLYEKYSELKNLDKKFSYYPKTFLHGDYRPDNALYISKDDVRFIDWANSGCGPCTLDLFWYLMSSVHLKADKSDLIYYYKQRLEDYLGYEFTKKTWDTLLRVGIICSCRMFLAAFINGINFEDDSDVINLDWWIDSLIVTLNSVD